MNKVKIENAIYTGILKNFNSVFNLEKTNRFSVNTLLKLPIKINLVETNVTTIINKSLTALLFNVTAEVSEEGDSINLTIFYSGKQKEDKLLKSIEANEIVFLFHYLTCIYRIIQGTNTYQYRIAELHKLAGKAKANILIEVNAIKKAMEKALDQIEISNYKNTKKLKELKELINLEPLDEYFLIDIEPTILNDKYKNLKFSSTQYILPERVFDLENPMWGYQPGNEGIHDTVISSVAESLITDIKTATKGNRIGALFAASFDEVKIDTKWFKKLRKKFNTYVQTQTNNFDYSWSSLDNVYRHLFKAPKKKYKDEKLNVILTIDQSGSISTVFLAEVFYLIRKNKKHIKELYVLVHDAAVTQEFVFTDLDSISENSIKDVIGVRYSCGGTSHIDCFRHIQKYTKKKDLSKFILMIATDGYSDIEDGYTKYTNIPKLTTIMLNEHGGRCDKIAKLLGKNITNIDLP